MDFEVWWLLVVPFSFALGWLAARVDIRQLLTESRSLPRSYFRGLNFLLSEQHDQAIDAFVEVVKLDPETIELHFALGNLFRRRGETERAIRIHQNLLNRTDLPLEHRAHALYELGQDYFRAGLLDRAEETFMQLEGSAHALEARRNLLEIFQREKEWRKAIDTAEQLQASGAGSHQVAIAQFHCELAQGALAEARLEDALRHIDDALAANRKSVRALICAGDIAVQKGRDEEAIAAWRRIEQHSPAHLALVAERLFAAYRRLGRLPDAVRLLRALQAEHPSVDLLETLIQAVLEQEGEAAAYNLVRAELHQSPSLLGLEKFFEAQLRIAPPEARADLELVKSLFHQHTRRIARYTCTQCGFKATRFQWQCPGCASWESYPPLRSEELDAARYA